MKTIFYFTRLGFSFFIGNLTFKKFKKKKSSYENLDLYYEELYSVLQNYGKKTVALSGSTLEVKGRENIISDRAVVFTPNHQSYFDIPSMIAAIDTPITFMSKKSILKLPVVGKVMQEFNCLTLDRDDIKEAAKTVVEAINLLKSGKSIIIYPEGTRSKDGQVGEFKDGTFKIAAKASAPIVPVTILGTREVFEENGNKIKPSKITVIFHKAIETKGLTKTEIKELSSKVHEVISSSL